MHGLCVCRYLRRGIWATAARQPACLLSKRLPSVTAAPTMTAGTGAVMIALGRAGRLLRFIGAALLSGHLTACATQPREDVHVAIGSGAQYVEQAKDYASLYL